MPEMYCPQCGRELELDSGEIRFCRYCGFSLADTKDALHGYSEYKRTGFSVVTCSYALLLIVTLLLHGKYVSLDTRWVYWALTALIVASVSFFVSAAMSALKPAMFSKATRLNKATLKSGEDYAGALKTTEGRETSLLESANVPIAVLANQDARRELVGEPRSVIEGTTKRLKDRSSSG